MNNKVKGEKGKDVHSSVLNSVISLLQLMRKSMTVQDFNEAVFKSADCEQMPIRNSQTGSDLPKNKLFAAAADLKLLHHWLIEQKLQLFMLKVKKEMQEMRSLVQ